MKTRLLLLLVSIAVVISGCDANKGRDAKNIEGTWMIADAQLGGTSLPAQVVNAISLKLDGGRYEVQAESLDKGTYTMDAAAQPKILDIYGGEGPNAGKHYPCIYELQGDVLKVCYQLGDGPRPSEFKSPAGTKIFLVTYHRKKV